MEQKRVREHQPSTLCCMLFLRWCMHGSNLTRVWRLVSSLNTVLISLISTVSGLLRSTTISNSRRLPSSLKYTPKASCVHECGTRPRGRNEITRFVPLQFGTGSNRLPLMVLQHARARCLLSKKGGTSYACRLEVLTLQLLKLSWRLRSGNQEGDTR